jgi:hypothetical protein
MHNSVTSDNPALIFVEPAYQLGLANPLIATRTLARALRQQSSGGRLSALRALIQALVEHDPTLAAAIRKDVEHLTKGT